MWIHKITKNNEWSNGSTEYREYFDKSHSIQNNVKLKFAVQIIAVNILYTNKLVWMGKNITCPHYFLSTL